jgi:hypothetical protein
MCIRDSHIQYGYQYRLSMKYCVDCHKAKWRSTKCGMCHISTTSKKPASHYSDGWLFGHARQSTAKCTIGCHNKTYCIDCHDNVGYIPLSHRYASWASSHRSSANANCTSSCHDKYYCSGCHVYRSNNNSKQ